eukprot:11226854-Lingulodinium_polyedra.AAC.1
MMPIVLCIVRGSLAKWLKTTRKSTVGQHGGKTCAMSHTFNANPTYIVTCQSYAKHQCRSRVNSCSVAGCH